MEVREPEAAAAWSVVCADDDPVVQFLYRRVLIPKGYNLRVCTDGSQVLNTLHQAPADLVILDLDMPRMTGLEVLRELRRQPEFSKMPVIMVSATDTEEAISAGLSLGADDYLLKPVKPAELLAKTAMALRKRKLHALTSAGFAVGALFAGRYEIVRTLGSGGFSTVYLARDCSLDAKPEVAVKVFRLSGGQRDETRVSLFLREAYEHSRLDHPNIVKLLDFGQADGIYFLAMEYLRGLSVHDIVNNSGPMTEDNAAIVGYQVARALHYMNGFNVVHRDIKPQNIVVTEEGIAKLLDFGLARKQTDDTLSVNDDFRGSPLFVSPEYILGESDVDIRGDIYSLGVTLYYLTTLRYPFDATTPGEMLRHHLQSQPVSLAEANPDLSPEFAALVDAMLAKEREQRPTIDELLERLWDITSAEDEVTSRE